MTAKPINPKESEALKHIRNRLMHQGRCPSVRELMLVMGYRSPRSAALLINGLVEKGFLRKRFGGEIQLVMDLEGDFGNTRTVSVPLVGIAPCGSPVFAEENIEGMIPVSAQLIHSGFTYFLLRARGDSMNQAGIEDGDFVLVRQQNFADNGDMVVALIDGEVTIKEFRPSKNAIVLKPNSSNKEHRPIILTSDFQIQGLVVATISNFE